MTDIKPIETIYNGYRFRSRLEARWAVFFDALGVEYRYEPEGFDLGGERYLPDFWIPEWKCWVEIKPEIPRLTVPGNENKVAGPNLKREYLLCQELAKQSNEVVMLIGGQPFVRELVLNHLYAGGYIAYEAEYRIALFCPDMLVAWGDRSPTGIEFELYVEDDRRVTESNFCLSDSLYGFIVNCYKEYPNLFSKPLPCRGDALALIEADKIYWANQHGGDHPFWRYGIARDGLMFSAGQFGDKVILSDVSYRDFCPSPGEKLGRAYNAARQARFGQSGRG